MSTKFISKIDEWGVLLAKTNGNNWRTDHTVDQIFKHQPFKELEI